MAASNIASTGIVLEVLTKDNYLDWSVLVKNYLIGKELWYNIVEGKLDREHSNWESKNGQALHAIQLSCGHHTLSQIRNFETAHKAWNHLKDIFSEDLKAADQHDIEQGCLQSDIDLFHMAIKKGLWEEANEYITKHREEDIISQKSSSSSKGWTSLHVAVDAVQQEIMEKLVEMGASLTEKDSKGYTPFALAAESPGHIYVRFVRWMLNKGGGGKELLTMKINSDDDKGDIPVLLAAIKGHKYMTTYLFSETPSSTLLEDNCYYGAKLLSHCIHAEIWGKYC
ncbi:hypothetical protein TSUD_276440 [Trifolium subterraneum]|uniref:Uncharacterized protein n=1 Tax=Trifolium subterraneum TaxID=3900 RepID=A0A2Z6N3X6_TRISU|nr:hypothetical protein TSUD_276440 [Trifolium subterraneum]